MMPASKRPLSPHLLIYKPQLTSVLSIVHRGTGVALAGGLLLVVYWLMALATGPDAFGNAQIIMGSWIGNIILFGFTFALFYHLCNGIRHLFWDAGLGLDLKTVYASGWSVLAASIVLSFVTWFVALV